MPNNGWLGRAQIEAHSLDMRQFIDFRQSTLPDGSRIIEAYNASGLTFTILPDRGLDIWTAHYNGLPMTWISAGSPFPPDFGINWLRHFNGGLLTTCGLTHAGPPETDPQTGEFRDLHGRYTRLRAHNLAAAGVWKGDEYSLTLSGTVAEGALFSEQLRLDRAYRLVLGQPSIEIVDRVTNRGDLPAPLMLLYHINLGYPLVRAGTVFHAAHSAVYSRDAEARKGYDRWPHYDAPIPRYAEQVYFHHPVTDDQSWTRAALLNDDFGVEIAWDAQAMPYLTQWKNVRQGIYVCGVEPGNCIPEGRNAAQTKGRLVTLSPGETHVFRVTITALAGAESITACREYVDDLRLNGEPVSGCQLADYA